MAESSEFAPLIDPRILERRLVDEQRTPVLIVTAATKAQRRLFAEFAREAVGELLADPDTPVRPIRMTAPSAVERGFTVSVVQIEPSILLAWGGPEQVYALFSLVCGLDLHHRDGEPSFDR